MGVQALKFQVSSGMPIHALLGIQGVFRIWQDLGYAWAAVSRAREFCCLSTAAGRQKPSNFE